MKTRVSVVGSERREALYPVAGGQPRKVVSHQLKVILHLPDGTVDVGTMKVPDALAPEGVAPGDYLVEFRAGRGFKEDQIIGVMHSFEAVGSAKPQQKPEAVKPQ